MMLDFLKALRDSRRGTATLEIAIILPTLVMLSLTAADFVRGFTNQIELQQYAQAGADFVVANGETLPSEADVKAEIVAVSGLTANAISVVKWTECNQNRQTSYGACPGNGDVKANYMEIRVTDTYQPILNIEGIADFVQPTQMTGTTVVRIP